MSIGFSPPDCHRNRNIQYVVLRVWLLSLSIWFSRFFRVSMYQHFIPFYGQWCSIVQEHHFYLSFFTYWIFGVLPVFVIMNNAVIELWNFKPRKYQKAYAARSLSMYQFTDMLKEHQNDRWIGHVSLLLGSKILTRTQLFWLFYDGHVCLHQYFVKFWKDVLMITVIMDVVIDKSHSLYPQQQRI